MSSTTIESTTAEATASETSEHESEPRVFIPRTDILETSESLVLIVELPGVRKEDVEITLEKHVLTIFGGVSHSIDAPQACEAMSLSAAEYDTGDYQRSFTLSDEIDRDGIEAIMTDGVLRLVLPKSRVARARKIPVKAGK